MRSFDIHFNNQTSGEISQMSLNNSSNTYFERSKVQDPRDLDGFWLMNHEWIVCQWVNVPKCYLSRQHYHGPSQCKRWPVGYGGTVWRCINRARFEIYKCKLKWKVIVNHSWFNLWFHLENQLERIQFFDENFKTLSIEHISKSKPHFEVFDRDFLCDGFSRDFRLRPS